MKKLRGKRVLLSLIMLCCVFVFTGCGKEDIEMTFTIGDARIKIDDTVQSIYDQGLVLCETDGTVLKEEDLPELKGRIVDSKSYCIGKKTDKESVAEPSYLYVYLYNTSSVSKALKECKIYQFWYNVPEDEEKAEVLINDVNFAQITVDEAVAKLEEMGLSYEQEDKDEFLSAESGYFLITSTNHYLYSLDSSAVVNTPSPEELAQIQSEEEYMEIMQKAQEEQEVKITEFKLEKMLDVEYK